MSILDAILRNTGGAPDDVASVASQAGTDPQTAEKGIAALGKSHHAEGDTIALAAQKTGISPEVLQRIMGAIGGTGGLAKLASMLDRDGDGNPADDVVGMAKGLFGKN